MPHEAEIPPGPNAGRVWRDPVQSHRDRLTRRAVHQLTAYRGHSRPVVGSRPCWLDSERLLVISDREGQSNLFACNVTARTLTQLTDLRGGHRPSLPRLSTANTNLRFSYEEVCYDLDLVSLRMRLVRSASLKSEIPPRRAQLASPSLRVGQTLLPQGRQILWASRRPSVASRRALLALDRSESRYAITKPCLDPAGQCVVFGADAAGYAQIFAVEIGELDTLPLLSDVSASRRVKLSATSGPRPRSLRA